MAPLTVLLIEDNPVFLGILVGYLERHAAGEVSVVGSARTGAEGLRLAGALRPDAVTLDLMLPEESGLELLPRLRALLPHAQIVILTQHDHEAYRAAAQASGADAFVPKVELSQRLLPALLRQAGTRRANHALSDRNGSLKEQS